MITDAAEWYVQKGARVQGPFSADEVGRFLMLGRVRRSDRVSRDGELWEPVTQVPELVPEALLDLDSPDGWRRFLDARAAGDERAGPGREGPGSGPAADLDARSDPDPHAGASATPGPAARPARVGDATGAVREVGPGIRVERRAGGDMAWRLREEWRRREPPIAAPRSAVRGNLLPWSLLCLTLAALCVVLWLDRAALPAG